MPEHDFRNGPWWAYPITASASGLAYSFGLGWVGVVSAAVLCCMLLFAFIACVAVICDTIDRNSR